MTGTDTGEIGVVGSEDLEYTFSSSGGSIRMIGGAIFKAGLLLFTVGLVVSLLDPLVRFLVDPFNIVTMGPALDVLEHLDMDILVLFMVELLVTEKLLDRLLPKGAGPCRTVPILKAGLACLLFNSSSFFFSSKYSASFSRLDLLNAFLVLGVTGGNTVLYFNWSTTKPLFRFPLVLLILIGIISTGLA